MLRLLGRVIRPLVCTVAVLAAAPATALAAGGSPLRPDPSPATSPARQGPAANATQAQSGGLQPDSSQTLAPVRAAAKPTVEPSPPVTRPATSVHVAPTPSSPAAPAGNVGRPVTRPVTSSITRSAPNDATRAPLHLGVRYALPPPFRELSRGRLLLPAALALFVLLLSSGSFLGLVYRLRRELVRV